MSNESRWYWTGFRLGCRVGFLTTCIFGLALFALCKIPAPGPEKAAEDMSTPRNTPTQVMPPTLP